MSSIMLYIFLIMCAKFVTNQPTTKATTPAVFTTSTHRILVTKNDNRNDACFPEKSWHSAQDIEALIKYIYNNKSLYQSIESNYTYEAQKVAEKHLNNITLLEEWMDYRPQHLLHILEQLTSHRKINIGPVVEIISTEINQNPQLETEFQTRVNTMQTYLREFDNYKMICKYNCMRMQEYRAKRSIEEVYYCSSLKDLYDEITSKLLLSVEKIKTQAHLLLNQKDKYNTKKVANIRKKIKEAALGLFSGTMYEILNLQDEYHHFFEDTSKMNISDNLFSIKNLGFKIDAKLLILSREIKKYGENCRHCRTVPKYSYRQYQSKLHTPEKNKPTIVDAVIKMKNIEIWKTVQKHIDRIFHPLNKKLAKVKNIDNFVQKIQRIKEKVEGNTMKERAVLDRLKNLVPKASVKAIVHLYAESQELLKQIKEMEQKLNI